MKIKVRLKDKNTWFFIAAGLILLFIIFLPAEGIYNIPFYIGPLTFRHWMSIFGTSLITIFVPIYSILKRLRPQLRKQLLYMHVYSGLIAFLLITTHFISHFVPGISYSIVINTGVGYILFGVVALLVITGAFKRLGLFTIRVKIWNYLHPGLAISLYIILILHMLRALI